MVLGGSGLAGTAIVERARARGMVVVSASRSSVDSRVDVADEAALRRLLDELAPRLIINAAAIVSVAACEAARASAWLVNARPASIIADHARTRPARVVHISTDHFYAGDGARAHVESEPVRLLNEYARTKYAAEAFALTHADTLVVRTNMAGLTSATGASFGEWALDVIRDDKAAILFADQYVSTLDVWSLAETVLDLAAGEGRGVLNVASSEVFSKAAFVTRLAATMGVRLTRARTGSVDVQAVRRPDSLGLDVSRAERLLGRRLPGLDEVVGAIVSRLDHAQGPAHALAI